MNPRLPIVCIFGISGLSLASAEVAPPHETTALDCRCFPGDADVEQVLIAHDPDVLVSIGAVECYATLSSAPFDIRRRWLHFDTANDPSGMGRDVFACYLSSCLGAQEAYPLVSVFTPTYRSGSRFARTLASMQAQNYRNWEWVLFDDSDDGGETHEMLAAHAVADHRIQVQRGKRHSGVIGYVKAAAAAATRGDLLVELDHDDELTPRALEHIVAAARLFGDVGFFYSDFAEIDARGQPMRYPEGWGAGFGSYRSEVFRDQTVLVANAPEINAKTIRGLVSCPNHVRAWRRSTYFSVGGHNRRLHVADDFDLLIRTFLATRMVRIPYFCYLQYRGDATTQTVRNADIQRHVRALRQWYDRAIHERLDALGCRDWVWDVANGRADMSRPIPSDTHPASLVM